MTHLHAVSIAASPASVLVLSSRWALWAGYHGTINQQPILARQMMETACRPERISRHFAHAHHLWHFVARFLVRHFASVRLSCLTTMHSPSLGSEGGLFLIPPTVIADGYIICIIAALHRLDFNADAACVWFREVFVKLARVSIMTTGKALAASALEVIIN